MGFHFFQQQKVEPRLIFSRKIVLCFFIFRELYCTLFIYSNDWMNDTSLIILSSLHSRVFCFDYIFCCFFFFFTAFILMLILHRCIQKCNQTIPLLNSDRKIKAFIVFSLLRKPILDESISWLPYRCMNCDAGNLVQGHVKLSQVSQPKGSEGQSESPSCSTETWSLLAIIELKLWHPFLLNPQ